MRRRAEVRLASELGAGTGPVWAGAIDPDGINDELAPLLRMTVPRGARGFGLEAAEPGALGRSWVLLFGLLPFDYDQINVVRIDPERGFLERSTMFSQRLWEHERTLEPAGEGRCRLTDRVAWEPRLPLPGALLRPLIRAIFRHRHRRLRRRFGGVPLATG